VTCYLFNTVPEVVHAVFHSKMRDESTAQHSTVTIELPDVIQVFNQLSSESLHLIAGKMLAEVVERAESAGALLRVAPAVAEVVTSAALKEVGSDAYGARGLRRSICSLLEDPLSELLLEAGVFGGCSSSASESEGTADRGVLF
jgi:ATP-dependent Clp protease ATP-binding subunit ClpA